MRTPFRLKPTRRILRLESGVLVKDYFPSQRSWVVRKRIVFLIAFTPARLFSVKLRVGKERWLYAQKDLPAGLSHQNSPDREPAHRRAPTDTRRPARKHF